MSTEDNKSEETENELIERSVAVVMAENVTLTNQLKERDDIIATLTKKLNDATDLIEQDQKASFISKATSLSTIQPEFLANMELDELTKLVRYLETAKAPSYKSPAPYAGKDDNPRTKLDNMYEEYMKKVYK